MKPKKDNDQACAACPLPDELPAIIEYYEEAARSHDQAVQEYEHAFRTTRGVSWKRHADASREQAQRMRSRAVELRRHLAAQQDLPRLSLGQLRSELRAMGGFLEIEAKVIDDSQKRIAQLMSTVKRLLGS